MSSTSLEPGPAVSSRWVLATVVLVAMLIGGNFTALKFALDHTSPILLAGMRTVVGGTFLLTFAHSAFAEEAEADGTEDVAEVDEDTPRLDAPRLDVPHEASR